MENKASMKKKYLKMKKKMREMALYRGGEPEVLKYFDGR